MNPTFIDNLGQAFAEVYEAATDQILINLARYFPYIHSGKVPRDAFRYQARMLAQSGQVNKDSVDIIMRYLGGGNQALRQTLEKTILHALRDEEPKLKKAAAAGILHPPVNPTLTPNQMQAFQAFYRQSADKLNLVNTVMLESTQAAYYSTVTNIVNKIQRSQSIVNIGAGEVVMGVSSWNEAMHDAVAQMVNNGLTGFIDHAGHRWRPETYVAMDIRTTLHNTARAAVWERAEEYGNDLYQVSTHNGARPLCYPWQAKIISRIDAERDVKDFDGNTLHVYAQSKTSYGQPAGLFGINCKHYPITFIEGISPSRGQPQDPEENEKTYEESQEQRALERKLRQERLDLSVMKAQGADQEDIDKQKTKVDQASDAIKEFCDRTGRARRRVNEYTPVDATWPVDVDYDPKSAPTIVRDNIRDYFENQP